MNESIGRSGYTNRGRWCQCTYPILSEEKNWLENTGGYHANPERSTKKWSRTSTIDHYISNSSAYFACQPTHMRFTRCGIHTKAVRLYIDYSTWTCANICITNSPSCQYKLSSSMLLCRNNLLYDPLAIKCCLCINTACSWRHTAVL